MKKSFFGDYILYKMRGMRVVVIASAVMNLLSTTLLGAAACYFIVTMNKYLTLEDDSAKWLLEDQVPIVVTAALIVACAAIVGLTIVVIFTPASAFDFFVKRNCTDTLGCLPLTYRQRFWGDFLSGLGVHMISFIPCSAAGLIFAAAADGNISDTFNEYIYDTILYNSAVIRNIFVRTYLSYILLLFVGYMGAYAVSCFVTVCCGRKFNAKACSLICQILPAGLVTVYCSCAFINSIGVDINDEWTKALAVIPPVGTWVSAIFRGSSSTTAFNDMGVRLGRAFFLCKQPWYLAVIAVILAALIIGAYFLGKLRRNERTGRDFVFKGSYYVLSVMTVVFIIGIIQMTRDEMPWVFSLGSVFALIIALAVYAAIELIHTRSFKRIWWTALKFITICLACQGFFLLVHNTGGFGAEKYLPPRALISEVRVSGDKFLDPIINHYDKYYIYRSDDAISAILSEHEKLLSETSDIRTGGDIVITYVLKNGGEVVRRYGTSYDSKGSAVSETLAEMCGAIRGLTPTDSSVLGFIDDPQYGEIEIKYHKMTHVKELGYVSSGAVYVAEGMEDEFMELLKHDIINNYTWYQSNVGEINIRHSLNDTGDWETYYIHEGYADTIAFLNDPANMTDKPKEEPKEYVYNISLIGGVLETETEPEVPYGEGEAISRISVSVSSEDESAEARELIGYLRPVSEAPEGGISKNFNIYSNNGSVGTLGIAKEDERAVIRVMLKYVRTHME